MKVQVYFLIICVFVLIGFLFPSSFISSVYAAEHIEIFTPFPYVSVDAGTIVVHPITIINRGDKGEILNLSITVPTGWKAYLEGRGYEVKSAFVQPRGNQSLNLIIESPAKASVGVYEIVVRAISADMTGAASISIKIEIRTSFESEIDAFCPTPVIQAPTGQSVQFEVQIVNRGSPTTVYYDLLYPSGWECRITELYGSTIIKSQFFNASEVKRVKIIATPPENLEAGMYSLKFIAASGEAYAEANLTVVITGTYKLSIATKSNLLNVDAISGEETALVLVVKNEGTGILKDITLSVPQEPSGWIITFEPEKLPLLNPGEQQYATLKIKPPPDALPGDYSLTPTATTGVPYYRYSSFNLRVSVFPQTAWGYIGIGIVVIVICFIVIMFWRFGRR